jgi:hypothetical protein
MDMWTQSDIAYICKYWNVSAVFIEIFQHNQQYNTVLPVTPCAIVADKRGNQGANRPATH